MRGVAWLRVARRLGLEKDLEERGLLDSTLVIYMGDNGYMWGEHGLVWAGTAWNSLFTTVRLAAIAAPICATLGLLIVRNFGLDLEHDDHAKMTVGYLFAYCGVIGAIVQGGLIGRMTGTCSSLPASRMR